MRAGAGLAIAAAVAIVGLTGSARAQTPGGDTRRDHARGADRAPAAASTPSGG